MSDCDKKYSLRKIVKLFANSGDPDQMPHSVASDLSLHYLPITLLGPGLQTKMAGSPD